MIGDFNSDFKTLPPGYDLTQMIILCSYFLFNSLRIQQMGTHYSNSVGSGGGDT